MQLVTLEITPEMLRAAYRKSLRTGKFFRLGPEEKAVFRLSAFNLKRIRSSTLKEVLIKILERAHPPLGNRLKALWNGLKRAREWLEGAVKIGYSRAPESLNDIDFIIFLGQRNLEVMAVT